MAALIQNFMNFDDSDSDDSDEYSRYYTESSMLEQPGNPDGALSPLEKLRKYCACENIFTRQMVARLIVETAQSINSVQECASLMEVISKLSEDCEPSVRCELMEQLATVAAVAAPLFDAGGGGDSATSAMARSILPVVVACLTDANAQARRLAQAALLQLTEQELVGAHHVEEQVHPVLMRLTEPEAGDDYRTEAVTLMTKLAPLIGSERTERLFLTRFADLCVDPLFHVRKVCASNFGDIASTVYRCTTETSLLPLFTCLCEDGVWGVRKACAEAFMAVSGACSRAARFDRLAPLFVTLLCDTSRWVQMAAYQALGQFIATFADPAQSGFAVSDDGTLVPSSQASDYHDNSDVQQRTNGGECTHCATSSSNSNCDRTMLDSDWSAVSSTPSAFNMFEYWRTPLPSIDDDFVIQLDNGSAHTNNDDTRVATDGTCSEETLTHIDEELSNKSLVDKEQADSETAPAELAPEHRKPTSAGGEGDKEAATKGWNVTISASSPPHSFDTSTFDNELAALMSDELMLLPCAASDEDDDDDEDEDEDVTPRNDDTQEAITKQYVVPAALLEHFISMTETGKAAAIDCELSRHCAFTLPGVALTLGKENWSCLRETYLVLAADMQWKVRRALAFSAHDVARILGEAIAVTDVVPVFNSFLTDLDEVRVGALRHLNDFVRLLPRARQRDYLSLLTELQAPDNARNWRFRFDLVQQMILLAPLYDAHELSEFITPVALNLAVDKVAEVREASFHLLCLVSETIQDKRGDTDEQLYDAFVKDVVTLGVEQQHWVKRKACVQLYLRFLVDGWYTPSQFIASYLPSFLRLCVDDVPNIRILCAKLLAHLTEAEYVRNLPEEDEVRALIERALEALRSDDDRDVRFFSGGEVDDPFATVGDDFDEGDGEYTRQNRYDNCNSSGYNSSDYDSNDYNTNDYNGSDYNDGSDYNGSDYDGSSDAVNFFSGVDLQDDPFLISDDNVGKDLIRKISDQSETDENAIVSAAGEP